MLRSLPDDTEHVLHVLVGGRNRVGGRLGVEPGPDVRRVPVGPLVLGCGRLERAVVLFGFASMAVRSVWVAKVHWQRGYSVLERPESHMTDR